MKGRAAALPSNCQKAIASRLFPRFARLNPALAGQNFFLRGRQKLVAAQFTVLRGVSPGFGTLAPPFRQPVGLWRYRIAVPSRHRHR